MVGWTILECEVPGSQCATVRPSDVFQEIGSDFALSFRTECLFVDFFYSLSNGQGRLNVASINVYKSIPAHGNFEADFGTHSLQQGQPAFGREHSPGHAQADVEEHSALQKTKTFALAS